MALFEIIQDNAEELKRQDELIAILKEKIALLEKRRSEEVQAIKAENEKVREYEITVFDFDDPGTIEELAAIAEKPVVQYLIESLRRDIYDQIMAQPEEKMMLNAAMKAKGLELLKARLGDFVSKARMLRESYDA